MEESEGSGTPQEQGPQNQLAGTHGTVHASGSHRSLTQVLCLDVTAE